MASKTWEGGLRGTNPSRKKEKQNISVFVRCRPFNEEEKRNSVAKVVNCNHNDVELKERATGVGGQHLTKKFVFDRVFSPTSDQIEVYQEVVAPVVKEALLGYNCTIFAYGQTGTGKTFTMEGERSEESYTWDADPLSGVIPRCIHQIFDTLESAGTEFAVRVSYMELYNEDLFDLLSNSDNVETGMKLKLFEDNQKALVIQNLSEKSVRNKHEVYQILAKGSAKRKTAETQMNAHSSRSHSIFMITIHMKEYNVNGEEELIKTAKLNLVDLAGSENIGRSGATGVRKAEAGNINQSLLTLGRVITALVDRTPHVPYRESKLTRLLQESLGGKTKTTIIATISPGYNNMEETLSTLDYAHRAKNITNKPEVNQKLTKKALIKQYEDEIEKLKRDLAATREKNGFFIAEENYERMKNQLEMNEEIVKQLEESIEAKEQSKAHYESLFLNASTKLEESQNRLAATRNALSEVHEKLKLNRRQRDEKAAVVKELEEAEKRLYGDLKTMINIADDEKENLEGVHDKLDRQREVDRKNEKILKSHAEQFSGVVNDLKKSYQNILRNQELKNESLISYVRETSEKQVAAIENSKGVLKSLSMHLENCISKESKEENNLQSFLKDLTEISEDGFKSLEQYMNSSLTKYIIEVMAEVSTQLSRQQESITTSIDSTITRTREQIESIRRLQESHLKKIEELKGMNQSQEQERQKSNVKQREKMENLRRQMMESWTEAMEGLTAMDSESKLQAQSLNTEIQGTVEEFSENISALSSAENTTKEEYVKFGEEAKSSFPSVQASADKISENVEGMRSEYAAKSKRRLKEVKKIIKSSSDIVEEVHIQAREVLTSQSEDLDQQASLPHQLEAALSQGLRSQVALASDDTKDVCTKLDELDRHETKFTSEEIAKNIPTGRTPKRKNFRYPPADTVLRARDPNTIVEEFEENYQLSESILNPFDLSFDSATEEDAASTATADSGRPRSREGQEGANGYGRGVLAAKQV